MNSQYMIMSQLVAVADEFEETASRKRVFVAFGNAFIESAAAVPAPCPPRKLKPLVVCNSTENQPTMGYPSCGLT